MPTYIAPKGLRVEERDIFWCSGHLNLSFASKVNIIPYVPLQTHTKMFGKADKAPRVLAQTLSL